MCHFIRLYLVPLPPYYKGWTETRIGKIRRRKVKKTKRFRIQTWRSWFAIDQKVGLLLAHLNYFEELLALTLALIPPPKNVWDGFFLAGNHNNHKNWVPSILSHNLCLISMGMKQKKIQNDQLKATNPKYFFTKTLGIGPWVSRIELIQIRHK